MTDIEKLRIVFMGTPEFAIPVLQKLIASRHEVIAVYTRPPKPAGRGHREQRSPVHELALQHNIPVYTPLTLRKPEEQAVFASLDADVAIVAAYGLILPKAVLEAPRYGCINVHASILPRWRGAAPIQYAVMAGDEETGVTIMKMDEGLDTGAILSTRKVPIGPTMTAAELYPILADLGAELLLPAVEGMIAGSVKPVPQPTEGVTYAKMLKKEDGRLDWQASAVDLYNKVRALNPWPGAWFEYEGEVIKVLEAEVVNAPSDVSPGTILDKQMTMVCGQGALRLLKLQRPSRSPVSGEEFLRGRHSS